MQNKPQFPPQRTGGVLPPLSKYYYGPAVSPERPSAQQDSRWLANSAQQNPPALPPRIPTSSTPSDQSQHRSSFENGSAQAWQSSGTPPTAPVADEVAQWAYNPSTSSPPPAVRYAPPTSTLDQSGPSVGRTGHSEWPVNDHQDLDWGWKPPLPPRPSSTQSQSQAQDQSRSQPQSSQQKGENHPSEYLQPIAYSPVPSPLSRQNIQPQATSNINSSPAQANFHQVPPLPPVPPPKIPPKRADEPEHTDPSKPHQTHSLDQHPVFEDDQHTKRERGPNYHIFETSFVDGLASTLVSHPYTERPNPHSAIQQDPPDIPPEGPGYAERPDGVGSMLTSAVMGQQNPSERPAIPSDNQQHAISKTPSTQPGVCTSETQEQKNDEKSFETMATEANRNSSFYWHSSHSSASIVQEGEQVGDNPASSTVIDSAPDPPDEPASTADYAPSSKVTDMYESILGPYSASALGLGGPSDWEHFGDYDGEEIDDTDLYTRHKPQPETDYLERSAELPADSSTDRDEGTDPANSVGKPSVDIVVSPQADKSVQSTIVPAAPDQTEVASSVAENVHSYDPESALQEAVRTSDEPLTLPPTAPESQTGESQNTTPEECTDASAPVRVLQSPTRPDIIADNGSLGQHLDGKSQTSSDATPARSNTDGTKNQAPFIHDSEHRLKSERQDDGSVGTNGRTDDLPDTQNVAAKPPKGASDGASPTQDHADDLSASKSIPDPGSRASVLSDRIGTPKVDITDDPFAKLDPWAKASLNRYVMMLHEEAQAQTNEDKFRIFKAFSHNETKLRAVIYGADDRPESMPSALATSQPASQNRPLTLRRPSSKALPALPPPDDNTSDDERGVEPEMRVPTSRADPIKSPTKPTAGALHTSEERLHIVTGSSNHAHEVQSEVDIKEAYSPGGRPIQPRISAINKLKSNAGDLKGQISEPSRSSVYKPFRYSQGFFEETATSLNRRTSYRPYAALKLQPLDLHPSHRESPVIFDEKTAKDATSSAHSERNEVLGTTENVTESSKASSSSPQKASSAENDKNEALDLRRFEKADFDPLVSVLPPTGVIPPESIHLQDLQHRMEAIPDDFSFIHQSMVTWDVKAKQRREEHEKQRQLRQGQSEQKIDALFNDDEIGYGDISELESEFKRSEASRKAGEDRAEYQTFVGEVFDVVWTRLHYEIDQLSPMYQEYTEIAHRTLAGKDMFEAASGQFALAPTMGSLLTLHQKLEVRHQKAFEAVLERDRRLKKTEISPWYALGNVTKVKQLEKQFDHAEKNAIVEFCYQRDARANRLMDVLDQNTLRGVGANQDYMEAVMKAVRRVASGRAFASAPANEPGLGLDEVMKAKSVTAILASSSEQIVQTFHVADMLLNAAEYEVSVAKAKLAHAEPVMLARLKEERANEDQKLMRDLQHRLALIREDSRRTNDEIVKLLCFLGVQSGHAGNVQSSPVNADAGYEKRARALAEAKKRNAFREAQAGLPPF